MRREQLELLYKYTEADQDTIQKLREISELENKRIIDKINDSESQFFHVPNYYTYPPFLVQKNIEKIGCLLPQKLIVATIMDYASINRVIKFRPFLENDIIDLFLIYSPEAYTREEHYENTIINEQLHSSNIELLTQSFGSLRYESFIEIMLPWLEGARPADYVELMTKYKLQYDIYCNHIDKIAQSSKNPDQLTNLLVQETRDAFLEIRIALEKTKADLKKKGIETAIGAVLTSIPLLIPESIPFISPELLSALLGATNILATVTPIIGSLKDRKEANIYNPYWILWEWSKSR